MRIIRDFRGMMKHISELLIRSRDRIFSKKITSLIVFEVFTIIFAILVGYSFSIFVPVSKNLSIIQIGYDGWFSRLFNTYSLQGINQKIASLFIAFSEFALFPFYKLFNLAKVFLFVFKQFFTNFVSFLSRIYSKFSLVRNFRFFAWFYNIIHGISEWWEHICDPNTSITCTNTQN